MKARRPHILSGTKRNTIPGRCIFFDSEARVPGEITEKEISALLAGQEVIHEHTTYLVCASYLANKQSKKQDYFGTNFIERFWQDVSEFTLEGRVVYMFAHNAKYDILACRGIPTLISLGFRVTSFSDDNPFILELVKGDGKYQQKLVILSTTNYYQTSLKNLGSTFGLEKLDAAFNAPLEDAIPYCRRDVEIIEKAMTEFFRFILENCLGTFARTLAGQSFNAYRSRFMKHDIFVHCDELAMEIERDSYCGGRTECFRLGNIKEKLFYLDENSMYPFNMLENKYPVQLVTARTGGTVGKLQWYLDQGFLLCARVEVTTSENVYPLKYDGRLIFPVGRFECSLATPELEYAIKAGHITKVFSYSVYHAENIFESFVEFFYSKRLEAKAANDAVLDYLYKIMLNSLYGKFGQKNIEWEEVGTAANDIIEVQHVYDRDRGTYKTVKIIGGLVMENLHRTGIDVEAFNSFPAISSHVTSYSRLLLWSDISIAGLDTVSYCDTDSIICSKAGYERLKDAGRIDDKTLGSLKLEKSGYFTFHGLKDYEFQKTKQDKKEVKLKGISIKGLESGMTIKLDERRYITTQWLGVSSMIKKGGLEQAYFNRLQIKELKREYTKGVVQNDGRIVPIVFS